MFYIFICFICFLYVSLEAGYQQSTATYTASHRRLVNLTFKRVVVVISSTETDRNNYESSYLAAIRPPTYYSTYGHLLKKSPVFIDFYMFLYARC